MKAFFLYMLRWQLTIPMFILFIILLGGFNPIIAAFIADLLGGFLSFFVDKWIFKEDK